LCRRKIFSAPLALQTSPTDENLHYGIPQTLPPLPQAQLGAAKHTHTHTQKRKKKEKKKKKKKKKKKNEKEKEKEKSWFKHQQMFSGKYLLIVTPIIPVANVIFMQEFGSISLTKIRF
jgi:hypothetical protein